MASLWYKCLSELENEISSESFSTWIRPLHLIEKKEHITLLAPNRFVLDWVKDNYLDAINEKLSKYSPEPVPVFLEIGSKKLNIINPKIAETDKNAKKQISLFQANNLNQKFTFNNFVEGKSNHLAKAASLAVADQIGEQFNPLLIYGASGLGKTHIVHAIGNQALQQNPLTRIVYLHSETFLHEMVNAIRQRSMNVFKEFYRSIDLLLIDDIQFFANKPQTQEEFFHTFNSLLENKHQVVLTCDKYPKEIDGLEDRLKSRFSSGLPVFIEPPDFETRAAILIDKAKQNKINIPNEVAYFIAKRIPSNVRDLEGALRRVIANAQFTDSPITLEFTKEALRDLISSQDKLIGIENIQKTVAEYYKIKVSDLKSKRRTRSITRPRQIAMVLARELTNQSYPEIGKAFGDRDHTTVINACKKVEALKSSNDEINEEYIHLLRLLSH